MTPRQLQLYDYIRDYTAKNRMAPTFREMQDHMGLKSPGNTYVMVERLEKQGLVTVTKGQARSIKVVEQT